MSDVAVPKPEDRIFSILFEGDDITWKDLIYGLVQTEGMDPWDIDVSRIADMFLTMLKKLKELDFKISGKVVLASSFLLKLKSDRLLYEDMVLFDNLLNGPEDGMDEIEDMADDDYDQYAAYRNAEIVPRTPQPRQRKVSVYDLVEALEKVLDKEMTRKRFGKEVEKGVDLPTNLFNLGDQMIIIQDKIKIFFEKNKDKLVFSDLSGESRLDKVYTFIPLLHLENNQVIRLSQKAHFEEIDIKLGKKLDALSTDVSDGDEYESSENQ